MQDDSQSAANWRRNMRRSIVRAANEMKKAGRSPRIFFVEDYPDAGPFLSEEEARRWVELHACVPSGACRILSRNPGESLCDVLRFVIAYVDGALGDEPIGSESLSPLAVRDRVRDAQHSLESAMEVLEREVL